MKARIVGSIFVLLAALGCSAGGPPALYSVEVYDPARNPSEDLQATIAEAQRTERRILLEVGGEWCSWCHALDRFLAENEDIRAELARNFVIMKVNMSEENRNQEFLSRYPEIPGYPHLFVLEQDGSLLHSQGTAVLEKEKSYSPEAFRDFIAEWGPGAGLS